MRAPIHALTRLALGAAGAVVLALPVGAAAPAMADDGPSGISIVIPPAAERNPDECEDYETSLCRSKIRLRL